MLWLTWIMQRWMNSKDRTAIVVIDSVLCAVCFHLFVGGRRNENESRRTDRRELYVCYVRRTDPNWRGLVSQSDSWVCSRQANQNPWNKNENNGGKPTVVISLSSQINRRFADFICSINTTRRVAIQRTISDWSPSSLNNRIDLTMGKPAFK